MTFTENAKAHARAQLGMGDDEPNAATGATGHAEFEWIASIFDSAFEAGRSKGAETALKAALEIVASDEIWDNGTSQFSILEAIRALPTETGTES